MKEGCKISCKTLLQDDCSAYFIKQSAYTLRFLLQGTTSLPMVDWVTSERISDAIVATEILASPWGNLRVWYTEYGIRKACFTDEPLPLYVSDKETFPRYATIWGGHPEWLQRSEFWQGKLAMTIKIHVQGTPFQRKVWQALTQLPYGGVLSYGALAEFMQLPSSTRSVASAVARNPVAWFIPCHRIIPVKGGVGAYRWSSQRKKSLLDYERQVLQDTL